MKINGKSEWKKTEKNGERDKETECKHSGTHRSQIPRQSIKRLRLSTPQSTPHNPAHGLHTIHTLLFPSWKHTLASTQASGTHSPVLLHTTAKMLHNAQSAWFLHKNKTSEFCFNCSALGGSKSTLLWRFCGWWPAAGLKTFSTTHHWGKLGGTWKWEILSCRLELKQIFSSSSGE